MLGDDLPGQVFLYLLDPTVQLVQEPVAILHPAQGQRHQPQTDHPAFYLLLQCVEGVVTQGESRDSFQQCPCLPRLKAQVLHAHLGYLTLGPQAVQLQRRVTPGDDDQMQRDRRVRQQLVEQLVDW